MISSKDISTFSVFAAILFGYRWPRACKSDAPDEKNYGIEAVPRLHVLFIAAAARGGTGRGIGEICGFFLLFLFCEIFLLNFFGV